MRHLSSQLLIPSEDVLGECPVWDPERSELLWTDIHGKRLHRVAEGSTDPVTIGLDRRLCSFAVADNGMLLAAFDTGLGLLDRDNGRVEWLVDVEADRPDTRCNDGRPDRNGNFVFGTMVEGDHPDAPAGHYYQWSATRGLTHLYRGARIANGLCFGADGLVVHYGDSAKGVLWRARYHPQHALFIEDEVFVGQGVIDGSPDGACVDTDGNVWNARWGASGVACISPDGELLAFVDVDAPHVSACAFGGTNLERLYITTAREHLDPQHPRWSTSGSLYVADVGCRGLAPVPIVTGSA